MSQITGNSGSLNSKVEFEKWKINQNADGAWHGRLELPFENLAAISESRLQALMARFYKGSDTFEGEIVFEHVNRNPVSIVQFRGNGKLKNLRH